MDREMMKALEADGEKLRQMTGEDHGPVFMREDSDRCQPRYTVEPHGETFRVIDHNDERPVENSYGAMEMPRDYADMLAEILNQRFGGPGRW